MAGSFHFPSLPFGFKPPWVCERYALSCADFAAVLRELPHHSLRKHLYHAAACSLDQTGHAPELQSHVCVDVPSRV